MSDAYKPVNNKTLAEVNRANDSKYSSYEDYAKKSAPGVLSDYMLEREENRYRADVKDIYDVIDYVKTNYRANNPEAAYEALADEVVRLAKLKGFK